MAISLQTLRAEGVLDIGGISGTSFVYVVTQARLCMFHVRELPPRQLDAYGAHRAVYWIERGTPSYLYAEKIGVTQPELRRALLSIGYARLSAHELAQIEGARAARKVGNRRGPLVLIKARPGPTVTTAAASQPRNPTFNDASVLAGSIKKSGAVDKTDKASAVSTVRKKRVLRAHALPRISLPR